MDIPAYSLWQDYVSSNKLLKIISLVSIFCYLFSFKSLILIIVNHSTMSRFFEDARKHQIIFFL